MENNIKIKVKVYNEEAIKKIQDMRVEIDKLAKSLEKPLRIRMESVNVVSVMDRVKDLYFRIRRNLKG